MDFVTYQVDHTPFLNHNLNERLRFPSSLVDLLERDMDPNLKMTPIKNSRSDVTGL